MNNTIIQGLWLGNPLSVMEQLSISSFIKNGHEYHLYVYEDLDVPQGTVLKNAAEILSRSQIFKDRTLDSFANFSDVFRYKLLLERGGYWADTDTVCLKPFNFQSDYVFATERTENGTEERIKYGTMWVCGGVIKAPAGSEIMQFCYETSLLKASGDYAWWELGPPMITEAVMRFGLAKYVVSYRNFVPIDWWDWKDIISDRLSVRLRLGLKLMRGVFAVHLWNSMWTRNKANKNSIYHSKSLYERLKKKYLRQ